MDTKIQTGSISGIRTYAKDLEKKKAENGSAVTTVDTKAVTKPELITAKKAAERKYQAPSWTGNKKTSEPVEVETEKVPEIPKVPEPTLKPISAPKTTSTSSIVIDNEDAASAVILSDTKKDRFKLFPRIISSISNWFSEIKRKRNAKKIPKYTIPEATRRKGVIQRATSQTGKLTSFDHTSIQERIRARQERATPKEPLTIWTAKTEPGYPLLEAPEETVTNVQVFSKKSFRTEERPPVLEEVVTKQKNNPPPPPAVAEVPLVEEVEPTEYAEDLQEPATEPDSIPQYEEVEPEPAEKEYVATEVKPVTVLKPGSLKEWLFLINTNAISLGVVGIVAAIGIVGTAGFLWYGSQVNTLEITTTPNHKAILTAPLQLVALPVPTKESIIGSVRNNTQQSSYAVLQLIFVDTPAGHNLVPAPKIITTLSPSLNTAFTQSVSDVYFGAVDKTDPFVILSITDATTAKGGMLAWEKSLPSDLSDLFSVSSTQTATSGLKFKDIEIDKTDLRILENAQGEVVLLYGLANRNTIIITDKISTYQTLVKIIK